MLQYLTILISTLAVAYALEAPAPLPTALPKLDHVVVRRANATCTFSGTDGYAAANATKTTCSTIVLSALTVPAGKTLNLEGLNDGTTVSTSL